MTDAVIISNGTTIPVLVAGASDVAGPTGPTGPAMEIATRSALAALASPAAGQSRLLAEAGREGVFVFSAANLSTQVAADPNQGIYVAPASAPTGASGAWVRKYPGELNAAWFGTDSAAMAAVQNFVGSLARAGYGYNVGVPMVRVPFSVVNFTAAFDVTWPIRWVGEGADISNAATVFVWNNTSSGLRIQYADTTGDSGTQAPASHSGSGATFEGIHFEGGYDNLNEAERHAVHVRAKCTFRRCNFFNWAGDGIHIDADVIAAQKGNANLVKVEDCLAQNCRNGYSAAGGDTNACDFISWDAIINRRWGALEGSFLGNKIIGGHFDSNGRVAWNTGAANRPCSYVSRGGNWYFVIEGQAAGASTNAPKSSTVTITIASPGVVSWTAHGLTAGTQVAFSTTGALPTGLAANTAYYVVNANANDFQVSATLGGAAINTTGSQSGVHTAGAGVDNTWWGWWQAGGVATGVPAWFNGIAVRSGGPICVTGLNNASAVIGPHVEINGVSQYDQQATVIGSSTADAVKVSAGVLYRDGLTRIRATVFGVTVDGKLSIAGGVFAKALENFFGPTTGVADGILYLESTNATSTLLGRVNGVEKGRMIFSGGVNGTIFDANAAEYHRIGGTIIGLFDATGFTVTGIGAFSGAVTGGSVVATGLIKSSSATAGIGYATGAGGAVTQATSRTTTVTLNKICGAITLFSAAGSAAYQSFSVSNSAVAATDTIIVNQKSGTDKYIILVTNVTAGGFQITFATTGGTTTETPVFNFAVLKAVAA